MAADDGQAGRKPVPDGKMAEVFVQVGEALLNGINREKIERCRVLSNQRANQRAPLLDRLGRMTKRGSVVGGCCKFLDPAHTQDCLE